MRTFTHGHTCPCADCEYDRASRAVQVQHVQPTPALPESIVSMQELVTMPRTPQPVYEIGEDWNDD